MRQIAIRLIIGIWWETSIGGGHLLDAQEPGPLEPYDLDRSPETFIDEYSQIRHMTGRYPLTYAEKVRLWPLIANEKNKQGDVAYSSSLSPQEPFMDLNAIPHDDVGRVSEVFTDEQRAKGETDRRRIQREVNPGHAPPGDDGGGPLSSE
jgi:hypothetical protein